MRFPVCPLILATILVGCSAQNPSRDGRSDLGSDLPRPTDSNTALPLNVNPPAAPTSLVFIHLSVGERWLSPAEGDLREQLNQNRYFVRDTNYGWGPNDADSGEGAIGDHTDIGQWSTWFLGPHREAYLGELYKTDHLTEAVGPNSIPDPGGAHTVVLFKSRYQSAQRLHGKLGDAPVAAGSTNPIYGKDHNEDAVYTVANIKGLYRDLLAYFATRQDILYVLATTPPSMQTETDEESAALLRDINTWLVRHWLEAYAYHNVAVFDLSNVLTSNGGSPDQNDIGATAGSHHRFNKNAVEHLVVSGNNYLAYPTQDSHPTPAGTRKAAAEFLPLLNAAYHCWKGSGGCPRLMGRP